METDITIYKDTKVMVECPCQDPELIPFAMVKCPICNGAGEYKAKVKYEQTVLGYIEEDEIFDDMMNDLDPPPINEGYE